MVEVRKEGLAPWRQTVTVPAGQQAKVAATFGAAGGTASLRIISNEPDVEVYIDGEPKGKAPLTLQNLKAGEHIVGGRKIRYKTNEQTVRVAAGESAIVSLRMEVAPPDRPKASLKVQSTVPNAEVFVDGSSLGRAPIDRNDLDPGKHYVVVHRDGFTDFKREIVLLENQQMVLVADLAATGSLRILSTPEGAEVRIDGELVGRTPLSRDAVGAGEHVVEFRLKGYFDHKERMKVEGGREKIFSVDLKQLPTGPSPEQVAKRKQGMSSFGAKVNPVGGVTADFGAGYPYYFMSRLTVGAFNVKPLGLDLGVEFQTHFNLYNLSLHSRLQLLEAGPLSAAIRGNLGGGTGTNGRDTYFVDIIGRSPRWRSPTSRPSQAPSATRPGRTSSARAQPSAATASRPNPSARRAPSGRRCSGPSTRTAIVFREAASTPASAPRRPSTGWSPCSSSSSSCPSPASSTTNGVRASRTPTTER